MINYINWVKNNKLSMSILIIVFVITIYLVIIYPKKHITNSIIILKDNNKHGSEMENSKATNGGIELSLVNIGKNFVDNKHIASFPFKYNNTDFNRERRLRNLISDKNQTSWYFFEFTEQVYNWDFYKIEYDMTRNKVNITRLLNSARLTTEDKKSRYSDFDYNYVYRYTDINEKKEEILSNQCDIINLRDKIYKHLGIQILADRETIISYSDAKFLNEQCVVFQLVEYPSFKNWVGFYQLSSGKTACLEAGYGLVHQSLIFLSPIDINRTTGDVAFFYRKEKNESNFTSDQGLILATTNKKNMKVANILKLPENYHIPPSRYGIDAIMKWCPKADSSIVAIANIFPINLNINLILVDMHKRRIIKELKADFETISLRWSPDGKKIGILSREGKMYIYDLEKDSLDKIAEDKDYFDFFWVNREKNLLEKTVEKTKLFFGK